MENKQYLSGLSKEDFQREVNGKAVDLYFLTNENGLEVAITNYGGAIVSIMTPDNKGNFANIIQGHDKLEDYLNSDQPFLSTLVGRYANRIAKGRFYLNGKEYHWRLITEKTTCTAGQRASTLAFGMLNK